MAINNIKLSEALLKELDRDLLNIYVSSDINLSVPITYYSPRQLKEILGDALGEPATKPTTTTDEPFYNP